MGAREEECPGDVDVIEQAAFELMGVGCEVGIDEPTRT